VALQSIFKQLGQLAPELSLYLTK